MMETIQAAPVASFFFAITLVTSLMGWTQSGIIERFLLVPYRVVRLREWDRLLTHTLIHADGWHLAFNLFTYFAFAFVMEEYFVGHWGFLLLYVGGAVGASLPDVIRYRDLPHFASLGASGAIAAVIFGFVLFAPTTTLIVGLIVPMPAWLFALLYLLFCYLMDRRQQPDMFGNRINHGAHLWGAISGMLLTPLIEPRVLELMGAHLSGRL